MIFKLMVFSGVMLSGIGSIAAFCGTLPVLLANDFTLVVYGITLLVCGLALEFIGGWGRYFQRT